jgi:hypothetical protein
MDDKQKARVLKALYNHSKPVRMAILTGQARPDLTTEAAEAILAEVREKGHSPYFDYLYGRVLKVDLDRIDYRLYDRDNGDGAGARAVGEELVT